MRSAKKSRLRKGPLKNGTNRDGNERVRKGLGCTNRSIRMDWYSVGRDGSIHHPTGNKIARQCPADDFGGEPFDPFGAAAVLPVEAAVVDIEPFSTPQEWADEFHGVFSVMTGERLGDLSDIDVRYGTGEQIVEIATDRGYRFWRSASDVTIR